MCEALRSDGRYRTISNLSYSFPLNSVNGFIPDSESETEYPSFFEVASSMVAIGLDQVFFSLFDVHSAYRNLRIACADWRFSIIAWKNLSTGERELWLEWPSFLAGKVGAGYTIGSDVCWRTFYAPMASYQRLLILWVSSSALCVIWTITF